MHKNITDDLGQTIIPIKGSLV